MIVRVSEKTGEIELAGNANELEFLAKQLLIDNTTVNLEYKNSDLFPYSKNLESIQIRHLPNQAVKISVEDNSLIFAGDLDKLRVLSENIGTEEKQLENYHIHIEYFDGHFYLSKDSEPLVVSFQ